MESHFKIISTLWPASLKRDFIEFCVNNGQGNFRLNGSHLDLSQMKRYIHFVREISSQKSPEIYLDLQGNKMRIGYIKEPLEIEKNGLVFLILGDQHTSNQIPIPHPELFEIVNPGDKLLLQDGAIQLEIVEHKNNYLIAKALTPGLLRGKSGIVLNKKSITPQFFPDSQIKQIQVAAELGVKHLALSYVSNKDDLIKLRSICHDIKFSPGIIAKIECPEALEQLDGILEEADEVWYCRGDLGTLIPWKDLGPWQEQVIKISRKKKKPVFVAGQVFLHLLDHSWPTRTEVVHFHHLLSQEVQGIVLSDETAIGQDPLNTIETILSLI